jgi:hypothetical protein
LIANSHDDLGWIKTIDEYFKKFYDSLYVYSVNNIISDVIDSLIYNDDRRFTWSEMKYLKMWWDLQNDFKKS